MTGQSVAQIFEEEGEEAFREVEAAVLNEVASYARMVVSTGGGVALRPLLKGAPAGGEFEHAQARN